MLTHGFAYKHGNLRDIGLDDIDPRSWSKTARL